MGAGYRASPDTPCASAYWRAIDRGEFRPTPLSHANTASDCLPMRHAAHTACMFGIVALRACLVFIFSTLKACKSTARGKPEGRNPRLGRFNIKSTLKACKNKNIAMGIEIPSGLLNRL